MDEQYPVFLPSQHFMDKAIKWLLSLPHHFQELLEFLAPELAEKLDFSTLEKLDPSLISPEFRESLRDAFFRISTKKTSDGPKELVIHVLMEHQSRPISKIRYRFQKSQMRIWTIFEERQRDKKKSDRLPFPPILPFLIYTGKENWQVPSLNEYFGFPKEYAPFTPEVEILFLGLYTERGREFIQTRKFLALCFDLLRHEDLETSQFQKVLEKVIKDLEKRCPSRIILEWELQFMIRLIYHRRPIEERDLLVEFITDKLPEEIEEEIISMKKSYADVLYEEGMQKGMQKGMQEGLQKGEIKKAQEAILRVLEARFESVSKDVEEKVRNIQDIKKLDELVVAAAKCQSLEEFEAGL